MIEAVSYPSVLSTWDPLSSQPYFVLYGETIPRLCSDHEQVVPSGSREDAPQTVETVPIYEYFWTIGISEDRCSLPDKHTRNLGSFFSKRKETGAEVWLFFPFTEGWRACEVVATVNYLRPLPQKHKLLEKVAQYWTTTAPALEEAANLAKILPSPATDSAAAILNVLARLRITSLPPVDGYQWSVNKVTTRVGSEVVEGVHWKLPASMFELGSRLTGSVAVYFHPTRMQQNEADLDNPPLSQSKPILARAVVHLPDADQCAPKDGKNNHDTHDGYIKLYITPCLIPVNVEGRVALPHIK